MTDKVWLTDAEVGTRFGTTRQWDCTCQVAAVRPACPVHALTRQCERVRVLAASIGRPVSGMPLFPTQDGDEVDRCAAVGSIFAVAELTGAVLFDEHGSYQYGGHSLRTGGAHMLASCGLNPIRIQSLGRWKSELVSRYAGESLSAGLAAAMSASCLLYTSPSPRDS